MNDFQEESIKKYMQNYSLFMHLLQNKEGKSDQELIRLLQDNHMMSRSVLIDLGVTFHEVDNIRSLNQRVRDLEANQANASINLDSVSIYIQQINEQIKESLSTIGLYSILYVAMNPNLEVTVRIMSSSTREPSRSNFRSQEDFEVYRDKKLDEHNRFMTNFEVLNRNTDGFVVAYTNSNIALIQDCIEKSLGISVDSLEFVIDNIYDGEKPNQVIVPYLSELTFRFWTLPSTRSMSDTFKNRY